MSVEEMMKTIEEKENTMIKLIVFESHDRKLRADHLNYIKRGDKIQHIVVKKISSPGYADKYYYIELWNNYNVVSYSQHIHFENKEMLKNVLNNYTQLAERGKNTVVNFEFMPLEELIKMRDFIRNIERYLLAWS